MKIEKLYETAKDTEERIYPLFPKNRTYDGEGWIPTTLTLKPEVCGQKFYGFGGALTESSGYVLSHLPQALRKQAIEAYYNPKTGNAYHFARIHMNSCDFSLDNWACVPEKDERLKSFSMDRTDKYISPLAMDVQKTAKKRRQRRSIFAESMVTSIMDERQRRYEPWRSPFGLLP